MENKINSEQCCVTQCDSDLDAHFWDAQYQSEKLGWDLKEVSPPIKEYIDQLVNKNLKVLIPGCGNTYEAEYLLQNGFKDITVIDIAPTLIKSLQQKFKNYPQIKVIQADFFEHVGKYDLILEQTFFCAINPALRQNYADKMNELLVPGGKLVGLLFDKEFDKAGPPFGGCKCKYVGFFEKYFNFEKFELCYNSVLPRKNSELFINFIKKEE